MTVHRTLGPGLIREAYEECLALELRGLELSVERGRALGFDYRGHRINSAARLDLIVDAALLVQVVSAEKVADLENTAQLDWLMDLCRSFFGFEEERITPKNWEKLYDAAAAKMAQKDWEEQVLKISRLDKVFLTNEYDDPLTGFDTRRYVPCLRTDDLVFHFTKPGTRERLAKATGVEVGDSVSLRKAIGLLTQAAELLGRPEGGA